MTSAEVVHFDGSDLLPDELGEPFGETLQEVLRRPDRARELMRAFQRTAASAFNG
jgi:hypothetical protein